MPVINQDPLEKLARDLRREVKNLIGKDLEKDSFSEEEINQVRDLLFPESGPSKFGLKILKMFKDIWFP